MGSLLNPMMMYRTNICFTTFDISRWSILFDFNVATCLASYFKSQSNRVHDIWIPLWFSWDKGCTDRRFSYDFSLVYHRPIFSLLVFDQ